MFSHLNFIFLLIFFYSSMLISKFTSSVNIFLNITWVYISVHLFLQQVIILEYDKMLIMEFIAMRKSDMVPVLFEFYF